MGLLPAAYYRPTCSCLIWSLVHFWSCRSTIFTLRCHVAPWKHKKFAPSSILLEFLILVKLCLQKQKRHLCSWFFCFHFSLFEKSSQFSIKWPKRSWWSPPRFFLRWSFFSLKTFSQLKCFVFEALGPIRVVAFFVGEVFGSDTYLQIFFLLKNVERFFP